MPAPVGPVRVSGQADGDRRVEARVPIPARGGLRWGAAGEGLLWASPAHWLLQSGIPGGLPDGETFSAAEPQAVLLRKLEAVTLSLFLHVPCCYQISSNAYT